MKKFIRIGDDFIKKDLILYLQIYEEVLNVISFHPKSQIISQEKFNSKEEAEIRLQEIMKEIDSDTKDEEYFIKILKKSLELACENARNTLGYSKNNTPEEWIKKAIYSINMSGFSKID
jgi:hypothetical protein